VATTERPQGHHQPKSAALATEAPNMHAFLIRINEGEQAVAASSKNPTPR